jgi:hypothetical protein
MRLTTHFQLSEFLVSEIAVRRGIPNEPPANVMANLIRLAMALEVVRVTLGGPIVITSGYRSPRLNEAVGGSKNSAHMSGWAVDFTCPSFGSPLKVCEAVAGMRDFQFDQCIHEFGSWCHLAVGPGARGQLLTIDGSGTREGLHP